jgi:hypothetical protein
LIPAARVGRRHGGAGRASAAPVRSNLEYPAFSHCR